MREFWSVEPRGINLKRLDTAPDFYTQAKSSPCFTNAEPEQSASPAPGTSPNESASSTATPPPTYKSPDGSFELILRGDPNDEDDQINGPGHGKHFVLRNLKTGTETEFGKIPGFYRYVREKSAALCYGMSMHRPGLTPAVITLRRSSE